MDQVEAANAANASRESREIEILVNEQPVALAGHRHTGLEIKQAAISQGVSISLDFVLSIERGPRQTAIIEDNELVTITRHSRFVAIPDDDNS